MTIDESLLKNEEKAVFALRALYSKNGYTQFKMSKFEEYDTYVENKDFLISDRVITFTDVNGIVYDLEKVTIQGGRIVPPPQIVADFMELKCKEEAIEKEFAALKAQFDELSHRFDTNSLNFLI